MKKFVPPVKKAVESGSTREQFNAPVAISIAETEKVASKKRGQSGDKEVNKRRKSVHATSNNKANKSSTSDVMIEAPSLCIIVEASSTGSGDWTDPPSDMLKSLNYRPGCLPAFTSEDASSWITARPGIYELLASKDNVIDAMKQVLYRHGGIGPVCIVKRDRNTTIDPFKPSDTICAAGNTTDLSTCSSQTTSTHAELDDDSEAITIPHYWGDSIPGRKKTNEAVVQKPGLSRRTTATSTGANSSAAVQHFSSCPHPRPYMQTSCTIFAYMGVDASTQTDPKPRTERLPETNEATCSI